MDKKIDKKQPIIYIRALERRDIPRVVKWLNSADYRKNYLTDFPISNTRKLKNQLLKTLALQQYVFPRKMVLVAEVDYEFLVGVAIFSNINWKNRNLTLQVYVPPDFQETQVPTIFTNQTYGFIFNELNMHKIYVQYPSSDEEQINSFKKEKKEPEAKLFNYFGDQQKTGLHIYSIFKTDYAELTKKAR